MGQGNGGVGGLVTALEVIKHTPLDEIPAVAAADIVRGLLRRGTDHVPVDVAKFGSAI